MKIVLGNVRSGKTSFLIDKAVELNAVIVSPTKGMADAVNELAISKGQTILRPITFKAFLKIISRDTVDNLTCYIIDELLFSLERLGNIEYLSIDTTNLKEIQAIANVEQPSLNIVVFERTITG